MSDRRRLTALTNRGRLRHDAARPAPDERPAATPDREELAARGFPFRSTAPSDYVAEHGDEMVGFTYDESRYADPELDAWLLEVGRLLQERRERDR
jgi:hypothetical protein